MSPTDILTTIMVPALVYLYHSNTKLGKELDHVKHLLGQWQGVAQAAAHCPVTACTIRAAIPKLTLSLEGGEPT